MKKIASVLLLSAAVSAPAFAANAGSGYVAVDLGPATFSGATFAGAGGGTSFPNPTSIHLSGGYNFDQNLAVEGGLVIVGDSKVDSVGVGSETLKTSVFYGAAVGTLPVNSQFEVFGKLGLASLKFDYSCAALAGFVCNQASASASKTNVMFGVGAKYNVNRNVSVRVQYENFGKADFAAGTVAAGTSSVGLSTLTAGVVYNF